MLLRNWFILLAISSVLLASYVLYSSSIDSFGWDLSAYFTNGAWMCSNGHYVEWLRPPIASLFTCFTSFYSTFDSASFLFLLSELVVFLVALYFACKKLKLSFWILIPLFFLNPFLVYYGFFGGSELLFVSLILFAIVFSESFLFYLFISLAFLTRYVGVLFFSYGIMDLLNFNFKKLLLGILVSALVVLPWLFYQNYYTGSFFTSFKDNLLLNNNTYEIPNIFELTFLAFSGIFLYYCYRKFGFDLLLFFSILSFIGFLIPGHKEARYLFPLLLFLLLFLVRLFQNPLKEGKKAYLSFYFLILVVGLVGYASFYFRLYAFIPNQVISEGLSLYDGCYLHSDIWIYFPPHGVIAQSFDVSYFESYLKEGREFLIYDLNLRKELSNKYPQYLESNTTSWSHFRGFKCLPNVEVIQATYSN